MKPFFMEDVLCIANGVRLIKADMTAGNRPFVVPCGQHDKL